MAKEEALFILTFLILRLYFIIMLITVPIIVFKSFEKDNQIRWSSIVLIHTHCPHCVHRLLM